MLVEGKGDRVITCPHCGYENPDNQILCIHCGLLLSIDPQQLDAEDMGVTRVLDNQPHDPNVPRWGTASLGAERKLLLHMRGFDTPLIIPLSDRMVIGRHNNETGESPDIRLDEYDAAEMGVSRRHAMIMVEDDGLKVMDLDSANFTFINGQKLIPYQSRILRDGDELRLGRLVIRVSFA